MIVQAEDLPKVDADNNNTLALEEPSEAVEKNAEEPISDNTKKALNKGEDVNEDGEEISTQIEDNSEYVFYFNGWYPIYVIDLYCDSTDEGTDDDLSENLPADPVADHNTNPAADPTVSLTSDPVTKPDASTELDLYLDAYPSDYYLQEPYQHPSYIYPQHFYISYPLYQIGYYQGSYYEY